MSWFELHGEVEKWIVIDDLDLHNELIQENCVLSAQKSSKEKYATSKQRFYADFRNKNHIKYHKKRYSNTVRVQLERMKELCKERNNLYVRVVQ